MEYLKPDVFENKIESYPCPKCHAANRADAQACQACGLLFNRFYAQTEDRFEADFRLAGLTHLIDAWQAVLSDYENPAVHRQFVEACAAGHHLEFAAFRYRNLDEVIHDDIAQAQLKQISGLAGYLFETAPDPRPNFTLPRYHLWFFVLGGLFSGIGLLGHPVFQALGLGALVFLSGLWFIRVASDSL